MPIKNLREQILFGILLVLLAFLFTGCTTGSVTSTLTNTQIKAMTAEDVVYKYDMLGSINDTPFDGVGVIPLSKQYVLKVESRENVDLLTINSCHRNYSAESAIQQGWFKKKRGYQYTYNPAPGIEDKGSCTLRFGSYNKSPNGQIAWGLVDFETPEAVLWANNFCDGNATQTHGVSVCQSKEGLIQKITFAVPVQLMMDLLPERCKIPVPADGLVWEYYMPRGECVYAFRQIGGTKAIHRHTTVGYNQIFIRGDQP